MKKVLESGWGGQRVTFRGAHRLRVRAGRHLHDGVELPEEVALVTEAGCERVSESDATNVGGSLMREPFDGDDTTSGGERRQGKNVQA